MQQMYERNDVPRYYEYMPISHHRFDDDNLLKTTIFLVFVFLLGIAVYLLYKHISKPTQTKSKLPIDIAKARLASGEISHEEYVKIVKELNS